MDKDIKNNKFSEELLSSSVNEEVDVENKSATADEPLDKNLKLMSPTRMVVRRFFRSKLSVANQDFSCFPLLDHSSITQ